MSGAALFIVNWLESPMSEKALGGYMSFVLFIGSAFNDAFEWQRKAIREECSEYLEEMKSTDPEKAKEAMKNTLETVQRIMGPDWQPKGEWAESIQRLLGGKDEPR